MTKPKKPFTIETGLRAIHSQLKQQTKLLEEISQLLFEDVNEDGPAEPDAVIQPERPAVLSPPAGDAEAG